MSAPTFVPSNALVAAFPQAGRAQVSIRTAEARTRRAAFLAALPTPIVEPFRPRATVTTNGKFVSWRGRPAAGTVARSYLFTVVTAADRRRLNAGPVVLIAMRTGTGEIAGIEAFEVEDTARLNAWIDRAAVAPGIQLQALTTAGTRAARAAIVADLSVTAPRARRALIVAGQFDRAAIMNTAATAARAHQSRKGGTWAEAMSIALRAVWQAAKADRLAMAH